MPPPARDEGAEHQDQPVAEVSSRPPRPALRRAAHSHSPKAQAKVPTTINAMRKIQDMGMLHFRRELIQVSRAPAGPIWPAMIGA